MTVSSYAQQLADRYNAALTRNDIEWAVNSSGGLYLRDREDWQAHHTKEIEREQERERRIWLACRNKAGADT